MTIDPDDELIEKLILDGALEVAGISSETGEFLFTFTNKLEEINPGMYHRIMEDFHSGVLSLWEKGFVNITLESEDPVVSLNAKALIDEEVELLDPKLKEVLREIMRMMRS